MEPGQTFICILFVFFMMIIISDIYQNFAGKPNNEKDNVTYVTVSEV